MPDATIPGGAITGSASHVGRSLTTVAFACLLAALWCLTHHYKGLQGDAELYAVQAFAKIHTNLASDLFLRGRSQDSYSIFSYIYAQFIQILGLLRAALLLTIVFKAAFFAASWAFARRLMNRDVAVLGVGALIVINGDYGAYNVFHFAEDWLTARTLAEALVIASMVLYLRGSTRTGILLAAGNLLIHPLMALPGILLLLCMMVPAWVSLLGAAIALLAACGIVLDATGIAHLPRMFVVMDPEWLCIVRERSQFLFLTLWRLSDWNEYLRPTLSLSLTALAIGDRMVRKICLSAMLVGLTGVIIGLIASWVPVSLLLQGQAWRWVWLGVFLSILFLPLTISELWRVRTVGVPVVLLALAGWLLSGISGSICLALAVALFGLRRRMTSILDPCLHWASVGGGCALLVWLIRCLWSHVWPAPEDHRGIDLAALFEAALALNFVSYACLWGCVRSLKDRSAKSTGIVAACTVALCIWCASGTFRAQFAQSSVEPLSGWRRAIPPEDNVLVLPDPISPKFAWFTLIRPSYLTVDQSSGVLFSRVTALEVRRRSQVLLPLMDPDWLLLSNLRKPRNSSAGSRGSPSIPDPVHRLTHEGLLSVCRDPELGFVIAKEKLNLVESSPSGLSGDLKAWNLYDCRRIRALGSTV